MLNNITLEKLKGIGVMCCSIEENCILMTHGLYVRRGLNVNDTLPLCLKKYGISMKRFLYV
jgi:hypothetical protein